jgi:hypothetical protein
MSNIVWRATKPLIVIGGIVLLWITMLGLSGCSTAPLLGEVVVTAERYSPGRDTPLAIQYQVGRAALVDIYILDAAGQRYELRRSQPRAAASDPYILRFDGSVPTDDPQVLRVCYLQVNIPWWWQHGPLKVLPATSDGFP